MPGKINLTKVGRLFMIFQCVPGAEIVRLFSKLLFNIWRLEMVDFSWQNQTSTEFKSSEILL
ncbi:MAG: hypothetical protein NPINA01_08480 [Nitrospinaceae bacterium]|nr:MAG: hypothetical protein NPINA01_08480 [Nitrospinaceae bacterium]